VSLNESSKPTALKATTPKASAAWVILNFLALDKWRNQAFAQECAFRSPFCESMSLQRLDGHRRLASPGLGNGPNSSGMGKRKQTVSS
jgi:hypothetical protein